MRCGRIRTLLALAVDSPLPGHNREVVDAHLAGCPTCAGYARRLALAADGLSEEATNAALAARPDRDFAARLRTALLADRRTHALSPSGRIAAAIDRLLPPRSLYARVVRAGASVCLLLAVSFWLTAQIARPPRLIAADYAFGHIASFSEKVSQDGRVYAALTERQAPGRRQLREDYPR